MISETPSTLSFESIASLSKRESGVYDVADDGFLQRAAQMISSINERGPYSIDQIDAMRRQIQRLLVNRLRLAADRERYPAIAQEAIERPIFIIGFPRSGTTLLHSLLAEDPEALSLKSWHVLSPSPPPGVGPVSAGRIAFAQRAVEAWMDFCPGQAPLHPYIDKGAHQLVEDEEVFTLDFRNAYPYHFYKVPTLENIVMLSSDQTGAFRFHHQVLQHHQWNTGLSRWVCKGPSGQHHLDAIFEVYPDALCVWPHRPLGEIYSSMVALRAVIYDTIRGKPNDWSKQARAHAEGMKAAFDRLMTSDLIDDPRILHMSFRDLAADPIAAVKTIYERRGLPFAHGAESRMRAWLGDPENQVDRYGRYAYSYEAFGLDKAWIEELFSDYSTHFGLN